jgi:3-hydroxyisobutyrate dehydrogenase-like beta-hydroxyacid dehydrogenase
MIDPNSAADPALTNSLGVLGLGRMGAPIAGHLQEAGYEVWGHDTAKEVRDAATGRGIRAAESKDELLERCDVVMVFVPGSVVHEVLLTPSEDLHAGFEGKTIMVCSTVSPAKMVALCEPVQAGGAALLDTPLCRGERGATEGRSLLLAGGERAVFESCRPFIGAFSSDSYLLGPVGAGQVGKLVNNLLLWVSQTGVSEAMKLADSLGVSPASIQEALMESSGASHALTNWHRRGPMPWAVEDMRMVLEESSRMELSLPLSGVVHELIKQVRREVRMSADGEPDQKSEGTAG